MDGFHKYKAMWKKLQNNSTSAVPLIEKFKTKHNEIKLPCDAYVSGKTEKTRKLLSQKSGLWLP